MTTEKHDPWALLAEARVVVYEYGPLHEDIAEPDLLARIDAALATQDADDNPPGVGWCWQCTCAACDAGRAEDKVEGRLDDEG